jgi:alkylation response protein AidB-like acyl-CoA dehydrogenase
VEFGLDETQQAVADLAADVLGRTDEPAAAWRAMAKTGLLGLALPESLGGDGLGALAVALVLAEVGRRAATVPALATLSLGVLPVVACGSREQQENLLPPVADGDRVLTAATNEQGAALTSTPRTVGDGSTVSGVKVGVQYAEAAHRILVTATVAGQSRVVLVDPHADGVTVERTPASGDTPEYRVTMTNAPAEPLGDETAVATLAAFATAGACALGDGLLAGALDLTANHIRTRHQFGRPLAAFQAVAQQIADVYVAARTQHLITRSACWRLDTGRPAAADLDVAAYWLAEELLPAMHTCHHLHGGLGVDVTYPMHRYYSQAKDVTRFLGGVEARLEAVACSSN